MMPGIPARFARAFAAEIAVLECMGDCGATFAEVVEWTGLSRGRAWLALRRLERQGQVRHALKGHPGRAGWWGVTH